MTRANFNILIVLIVISALLGLYLSTQPVTP
jgi:hypothetical protein